MAKFPTMKPSEKADKKDQGEQTQAETNTQAQGEKSEGIQNLPEKTGAEIPSISDFLEAMENTETDEGFKEATAEYLRFSTFRQDEKRAYLFCGLTEMENDKGEATPAVYLQDKNGKQFITAAKIVVNTCKNMSEGQPFLIRFNGMKKSAAGSYYDLSVLIPETSAH